MSFEQRYSAAHEKFFAENPSALQAIESVSAAEIEASGSTVGEYRTQQRYVAFAEAAQSRGLELDEFVIQLLAESPAQAKAWRLERHREQADALGIGWAEYKQVNGVVDGDE